MKTILNLCFIFLAISISFSCKNENSEVKQPPILSKIITACYDETWSADPWYKPNVNDSTLISNITNFLATDSIPVCEVTISLDGQRDACKSGFCKTGRRIKAIIDRSDLVKIQKIRFYECK